MKRREFLEISLATAGALGLQLIPLPVRGVDSDNKKMVVIFLRGAADVLSLFPPKPPTADGWLLEKHPLSKWRGGENQGAFLFDLYGSDSDHKSLRFNGYKHAFHPGFDAIKDIISNQQLSVFLHTGSMNETRSHFDQMDLMESGSSTTKLSVGYLARAASFLRKQKVRGGAIAVGARIPTSLKGEDVVLLQSKEDLGSNYIIPDRVIGTNLTRKNRLELFQPSRTAEGAIKQYDRLQREILPPWTENLSPFLQSCELAAKLTKSLAPNSNPPLITLDHGIWDHHVNGSPTSKTGLTYLKIKELSEGLRILYDQCDPETVVVVMSEFGRTVVANSNQGTDHGRGSAMMVMGKKIKMKPANSTAWSLTELLGNEESSYALKVKIDYREIIGEVLKSHLGIVDLRQVFHDDGRFDFDFKLRGIV